MRQKGDFKVAEEMNLKTGERVRVGSGKSGFLLGDVRSAAEIALVQLDLGCFNPRQGDGVIEIEADTLEAL